MRHVMILVSEEHRAEAGAGGAEKAYKEGSMDG